MAFATHYQLFTQILPLIEYLPQIREISYTGSRRGFASLSFLDIMFLYA